MAYKNIKDQAAASKRHYEANKEKIKKRTVKRNKNQRRKNREYVYEIKSRSECVDCGETNPIMLDFDHVRGKKVLSISDMMRGAYGIDSIQKEINKCEVRCSNCHRVATHKRKNDR